jgi:YegS/Rv2252/BmrU family lipid kinase
VNEVVNGIAEVDSVELAVIPRGTGIDFSRTYGISNKLDEAVRVALRGSTRAVDLGRAEYRSWAGRTVESWFANIASVGMSGAIAKRTNETSKTFGGLASYLWATLAVFARWRTSQMQVSVDGETRAGLMRDVIVANGRYFGGGMMICPQARSDDGLFDVLLIGDVTKAELARTLPKIYRGTHLPHPKGELLRGSSVSVESPEPLPLELDGEQPGTTPVHFEVVPAALRLRVPA